MIQLKNGAANAEPLTSTGRLSTHEEEELSSAQDTAEATPLLMKLAQPFPSPNTALPHLIR